MELVRGAWLPEEREREGEGLCRGKDPAPGTARSAQLTGADSICATLSCDEQPVADEEQESPVQV